MTSSRTYHPIEGIELSKGGTGKFQLQSRLNLSQSGPPYGGPCFVHTDRKPRATSGVVRGFMKQEGRMLLLGEGEQVCVIVLLNQVLQPLKKGRQERVACAVW